MTERDPVLERFVATLRCMQRMPSMKQRCRDERPRPRSKPFYRSVRLPHSSFLSIKRRGMFIERFIYGEEKRHVRGRRTGCRYERTEQRFVGGREIAIFRPVHETSFMMSQEEHPEESREREECRVLHNGESNERSYESFENDESDGHVRGRREQVLRYEQAAGAW